MEWLQNLLEGENGSAVQLVLITLLLMIGLILIVWLFRRIAGSPSRRAGRNRVPRLSITDSTMVDDKRYLVLVRRDNVEHLVLIGGPTDVVVETGIMRVKPAEQPASKQPDAAAQVKSDKENIDALLAYNAATSKKPSSDSLPSSEPTTTQSSITKPVVATAATVAVAATAESPDVDAEIETIPENALSDTPDISANEIEEALAEIAIASVEPVETPIATQAPNEIDSLAEPAPAEALQQDTQPEMENLPQDAPTPPVETPEPVESSLEESISAQLDDALSGEAFMSETQEISVTPEAGKASNADDEMQRLLDELAGEAKKTS